MVDDHVPNETAAEATAEEIKPFIKVEFAGELSANITLSMNNCSAAMMWAAAAMIAAYADDLWHSIQMQQAQQHLNEAQQPQSGLQLARSIPQDHKRGRN